jgi:hypothetical protein
MTSRIKDKIQKRIQTNRKNKQQQSDEPNIEQLSPSSEYILNRKFLAGDLFDESYRPQLPQLPPPPYRQSTPLLRPQQNSDLPPPPKNNGESSVVAVYQRVRGHDELLERFKGKVRYGLNKNWGKETLASLKTQVDDAKMQLNAAKMQLILAENELISAEKEEIMNFIMNRSDFVNNSQYGNITFDEMARAATIEYAKYLKLPPEDMFTHAIKPPTADEIRAHFDKPNDRKNSVHMLGGGSRKNTKRRKGSVRG